MRAIAFIVVYLSSAVVSLSVLVFALSRIGWSIVPLGAIGLCSWVAICAVREIAVRPHNPAQRDVAKAPTPASSKAVRQRA